MDDLLEQDETRDLLPSERWTCAGMNAALEIGRSVSRPWQRRSFYLK